jgi:hypothetical protein
LAAVEHTPQRLKGLLVDMLHLAKEWRGFALFYNGAKCGASAPDHAHLQAVGVADVPLLGEMWSDVVADGLQPLRVLPGAALCRVDGYVVPLFRITASRVGDAVSLVERLFATLPLCDGECEPRVNVVAFYSADEGFVIYVVPRKLHRPACYGARLVSPGTLDMCCLVITPREDDFNEITADEALAILREVALDEAAVACVCEQLAGV